MKTEKEMTTREILKCMAAYYERITAEYIRSREPFLAAAMLAHESHYIGMYGLVIDLCGERQGKKCGKCVVRPFAPDTAVNWPIIRAHVRVTNMDNHR